MSACAELGVHFSLDDFGTGYSSLTYFHRLPISILKIDQHFVRNMLTEPLDQDIVEGVLRLAEALKRPVVAEGVESIELGLMLSQLGCQYAQGYGIARPMPAEELPGWMAQWQNDSLWHALHAESQGATRCYDLNVSIFSHRLWQERVRKHLQSGLAGEPVELDEASCQFDRWYKGIGATRYAGRPEYPFIQAKHRAVHQLAGELVAVARQQGPEKALARIGELDVLSEELIAMLERLSEDEYLGSG
jgi:hypothetical protein